MRQSKSVGALLGLQGTRAVSKAVVCEKSYPTTAEAYELLDECGRGVSAMVYQARCLTNGDTVAIKALNLEALSSPLEDIMREAQTMKAYKHEAILPLYCSFVVDQELWMVMPFMEGGSVAHIMRYGHPEGLAELAIASIMREVFSALAYVHAHGGIHRDVKAGNVLVDGSGHVKLGDFGVATTLEREGDWGGAAPRNRLTFVGTPCWMAPEVLEQAAGYGSPADIWSAGITMLEMAHGHAPFSKLPPMKVLLMTLQGPPPQLEAQCGARHFSKGMREVVARCLNKDPTKRPSAKQLLEHKFFKQARDADYLRRHLLAGLPPLPQRVNEIKVGKAATLARENERAAAASHLSYITDVAQWDFNCSKGDGGPGDSLPGSRPGSAVTALAGQQQQQQAAAAAGSDILKDQQQQQEGAAGIQQQQPAADQQQDAGPGARDTVAAGNAAGIPAVGSLELPQPKPPAAAAAGGEGGAAAAAAAGGAAAGAAAAVPKLACFAGGKQIATFPVSTPSTPDNSPLHSRPTSPGPPAAAAAAAAAAAGAGASSSAVAVPAGSAAAAAAAAKTHGRFTFIEGSAPYVGPEMSASSATGGSSGGGGLARQRSVSSPDMTTLVGRLELGAAAAAPAAAAAAGAPASPRAPVSPTSSSSRAAAAAAASPPRHVGFALCPPAAAAGGAASPRAPLWPTAGVPKSPTAAGQRGVNGLFSRLSHHSSSSDKHHQQQQEMPGSSGPSAASRSGLASDSCASSALNSPLGRAGCSLADIYGNQPPGSPHQQLEDPTKVRTKQKAEHMTATQVWDHVREACSEPVTWLMNVAAHSPRRQREGSDSGHASPFKGGQQQQQLVAGPLFRDSAPPGSSSLSREGSAGSCSTAAAAAGAVAALGRSGSLGSAGSASSSKPPKYQPSLAGSGKRQQRMSDPGAAAVAAAAAAGVAGAEGGPSAAAAESGAAAAGDSVSPFQEAAAAASAAGQAAVAPLPANRLDELLMVDSTGSLSLQSAVPPAGRGSEVSFSHMVGPGRQDSGSTASGGRLGSLDEAAEAAAGSRAAAGAAGVTFAAGQQQQQSPATQLRAQSPDIAGWQQQQQQQQRAGGAVLPEAATASPAASPPGSPLPPERAGGSSRSDSCTPERHIRKGRFTITKTDK